MSTFVLIHGAWHGGWCWDKLVPYLKAKGHTAIAPDLPGHGQDETSRAEVTLESYAAKVCSVLQQQSEPVVLVGHSMGGVVISAAAERCPEKIRLLVYLAAFILKNGECLLDAAGADTAAGVLPNLVPTENDVSAVLRPEAIRSVFYADCTDADVEFATQRLTPQARAPFTTPIHISEENYHLIPRAYIECTLDRALSIGMQRAMHTATPCRDVFSMQTSHSPFLSAPEELARYLIAAAS